MQNTVTLFEKEQESSIDEMEEAARIAKEKRKERNVTDVKEYTSKFEKLADASNKQEIVATKSSKKIEETEEEKEKEDKKKPSFEQMKPIYSDEELAEIEAQEIEEEESAWDDDVDYEEFDEYYDD